MQTKAPLTAAAALRELCRHSQPSKKQLQHPHVLSHSSVLQKTSFFCSNIVLFRQSTSWSSWSEEQSEDKSLNGAEVIQEDPSVHGAGLYKCPSVLSLESVASTFLPGPSRDSGCSFSTIRLGKGEDILPSVLLYGTRVRLI